MRRLSPLKRRAFACCVSALVCVLSADWSLTAGQNPFKRDVKYRSFEDQAGRFELEWPERDWKLLPTGEGSLAVFNHKDGAALFVNRVQLREPMTPDEINLMPETELDRLKRQEPQTKDFKSDMFEGKAGRGVLIKFPRLGRAPESVVQSRSSWAGNCIVCTASCPSPFPEVRTDHHAHDSVVQGVGGPVRSPSTVSRLTRPACGITCPRAGTHPVRRPFLSCSFAQRWITLRFSRAFHVGRDVDCEVRVDDAGVSRRHVLVAFEDGHWRLSDQGSSNGVFVDGQRVETVSIDDP